jgi:N-methylhydantoinase A
MDAMGLKIGVDVGGTFTDVCVYDDRTGDVRIAKVPTSPRDQSDSVVAGIQQALAETEEAMTAVRFVGHGTTVGLNALLEKKGARIAFITTRGFRDVLELARQQRPELYNFFSERPAPLMPRHLRLEVFERTLADGTVSVSVDPKAVRNLVPHLRRANVEAVAIGFLNSYRNPENEMRAKEILEKALPGLPVTCSCEIAQEFREFERFSSVAMNAYLLPKVFHYLTHLAGRLEREGAKWPPLIFQSNGAVLSVSVAARQPIRTLMSGPAGGVLGAAFVATQAGHRDLLTFDMGGTSTDVSLIEDGTPSVTSSRHLDGYPIVSASFDVRSIGAGGGSIAWADAGGLIKVGPQSAGAVPGPACYGRGGTQPTVTDADAVFGYLSSDQRLGGVLPIDPVAASDVVERLGKDVGLDRWETAAGIIRIVTANIARLTQLVAFERGRDPRDFTLVAYGGAGPLHAGLIARELGIRRIFIPAVPGVLCALGMLVADLRADLSRTFIVDLTPDALSRAVLDEIGNIVSSLAALGHRAVQEGQLAPGSRGVLYTRVSLDLRYKGQNYEITVPLGDQAAAQIATRPATALAEAVDDFHRLHERVYGYAAREATVQMVTLRLGVGIEQPKIDASRMTATTAVEGVSGRRRMIRLVDAPRDPVECEVFSRHALAPGQVIVGPAIVEQLDATILILPEQVGAVDPHGNLIITEDQP